MAATPAASTVATLGPPNKTLVVPERGHDDTLEQEEVWATIRGWLGNPGPGADRIS